MLKRHLLSLLSCLLYGITNATRKGFTSVSQALKYATHSPPSSTTALTSSSTADESTSGRSNIAAENLADPDAFIAVAGWRIDKEAMQLPAQRAGHKVLYKVFHFSKSQGWFAVYWKACHDGQPVVLEFSSERHMPTAKPQGFVCTAVRQHGYKLAAFRLNDAQGNQGLAAAKALANRVFTTTGWDFATL